MKKKLVKKRTISESQDRDETRSRLLEEFPQVAEFLGRAVAGESMRPEEVSEVADFLRAKVDELLADPGAQRVARDILGVAIVRVGDMAPFSAAFEVAEENARNPGPAQAALHDACANLPLVDILASQLAIRMRAGLLAQDDVDALRAALVFAASCLAPPSPDGSLN